MDRDRYLATVWLAVASTAALGHGDTPSAETAGRLAGHAFGASPVVSASLRGDWVLGEGAAAIRFNRALLDDLTVAILEEEPSAETTHPRYLGFALAGDGRVSFAAPGGALGSLTDARLRFRGGFVLGVHGERIDARGFELVAGNEPGQLLLRTRHGQPLFTLSNAHTYRDATTGEFFVMQMDLALSEELAARLGFPELAGLHAGLVDLTARAAPLTDGSVMEPPAGECIADFGDGSVDVMLTDINDMGQLAGEAGVRAALAPSAKLMNVGDNDIRWYWAIAPLGFNGPNLGAHPFLVMNYYRVSGGVLEQVGRSELKHAWNTVNSNCPCSGGQVMFVGCEDTYGIGNNGSQFYFGPREELTAHEGTWESLGSHFDGAPVDDFRDHGDSPSDHDAFEHRLVVSEADLATPDAQFLVEAWYVVQGDVDIFNSMGHRLVSQGLMGATWVFSFSGPTVNGPAINAWVAPEESGTNARNTLVTSDGGHVQLAIRVTDLGAGQYHYAYALMNLDFDRKLKSFSVPILPGLEITNAQFRDGDADGGNDWAVEISDRAVTWRSDESTPNDLDWGTLFNFSVDADAAPALTGGSLGTRESGDPGFLSALTLAPLGTGAPDDGDADGILDAADNCVATPNPDQRDTDGDRYGNACDADLNGDGFVNFVDLGEIAMVFLAEGDLDADLNGDGSVNFLDVGVLKVGFLGPPGPSGTAP